MKLVQILLPVRDNNGRKFDRALYAKIHRQLVKRCGGLTAHTRSPARGLWNSRGATKRDDMIILEVMTKRFQVLQFELLGNDQVKIHQGRDAQIFLAKNFRNSRAACRYAIIVDPKFRATLPRPARAHHPQMRPGDDDRIAREGRADPLAHAGAAAAAAAGSVRQHPD